MLFLLGMVKHTWACPECSEIINCQYHWKGLSYSIDFLHVVRHSWKLQFEHAIFVWCSQACPKCSERKSCQYFGKVFPVSIVELLY